jgi:transcriptional regulator with GAF, ATPase, and Fis domain
LRLFGEVLENALGRRRSEEALRTALSEIKQLKERFEADYIYLREEIKLEHDFSGIVGRSEALRQILVKVKQVAPTNATVLILGETGTGKGLIARAIHNASRRGDRPLIRVNCAALNPGVIESELFGHEKGAFTGAQSRRVGRFEAANGTTLFLDEIGELPLDLQGKLLRVLEEGEFERVGGTSTIKTDVRVIAATNRDLEKEVEAGRFRRDLWYRLTIFPIYVPPLRERLEDIPLFMNFFVDKHGKRIGKKFDMIPQRFIKALEGYSWPGNIRELENMIERAVIKSPEGNLQIETPLQLGVPLDKRKKHEEFEREHILNILKDTNWIIEGRKGAAQRLGLTPSTLRYRMKTLDIKRQHP